MVVLQTDDQLLLFVRNVASVLVVAVIVRSIVSEVWRSLAATIERECGLMTAAIAAAAVNLAAAAAAEATPAALGC